MGKEKTGADRRKRILTLIKDASAPLSGGVLGKETGVSRQAVVQDIALLRTEGYPIISTPRGYYMDGSGRPARRFKVCHTQEQVEDELTTIIDLGGCVRDVMVNHRVYGPLSAPLNIRNRSDIRKFINDLQGGRSSLLSNITSGYHFHTVSAEREEALDEIGEALRRKNYLAQLLPYEQED